MCVYAGNKEISESFKEAQVNTVYLKDRLQSAEFKQGLKSLSLETGMMPPPLEIPQKRDLLLSREGRGSFPSFPHSPSYHFFIVI